MAKSLLQRLFGTKQEKDIKRLQPVVDQVNALGSWAKQLSDSDFPLQTETLKRRLAQGESLDSLLPTAFALAREASDRVLGERHYDEQIMGAVVLHEGSILEMKTGEGKTLTCVPSAYLNALEGKGVHIVTVNDYLASRDAAWMGPVYRFLGLSVGTVLSEMDNESRRASYHCDITYGTNNEFGFDYLRDNMKWDWREKIQPLRHYCIIDEIDSILIDEARTPLIISGQAADDTQKIRAANSIVKFLVPCKRDPVTGEYPEDAPGDFQVDEKQKRILFTNEGLAHIESLLQRNRIMQGSLYDGQNFEFVHYVTQAVKAHTLFHRDVDYVVTEKKVQIVDEFTGRILYGRRYSEGLHQAIEAKEGIRIEAQNRTLATITFQNYFRMYQKIAGMTGTADTEAPEFLNIYNLDVVVVPTHLPVIRKDLEDLVYLNEQFKMDAICDEIERVHKTGQPILVGTVSIEKSELLSSLLRRRGIQHEVLNAKNHAREALIIENAGAKGAVTIATNMAGRGTDIKLGGSLEARIRAICPTDPTPEAYKEAKEKVYPLWLKDYEQVKELGGLYVLGTERHEARRIDNQLRGRSGRQGDPGISRFFLSLDDTLMRLFARDSLRSLLGRIGMGAEPIEHSLVSRAIERAQMKVEEQNFEIRKHLLEYDDVLNEQRNFIYAERDQILESENLIDRAFDACREMINQLFGAIEIIEGQPKRTIAAITDAMEREFHWTPQISEADIRGKSRQECADAVFALVQQQVNEKIAITGEKPFNEFLRFQYLRQIDIRWQDHLERLEALREAVYLRTYAQKNPLLEYKLEGADIFDSLISDIRAYIAVLLVRVRIQRAEEPKSVKTAAMVAQHGGILPFSSDHDHEPATPQRQVPVQIRRTVPKVGRNDPCPCGSGKKYKYCHGA